MPFGEPVTQQPPPRKGGSIHIGTPESSPPGGQTGPDGYVYSPAPSYSQTQAVTGYTPPPQQPKGQSAGGMADATAVGDVVNLVAFACVAIALVAAAKKLSEPNGSVFSLISGVVLGPLVLAYGLIWARGYFFS